MVIVLIAAAVVSGIAAEIADAIIILMVVVLNSVLESFRVKRRRKL